MNQVEAMSRRNRSGVSADRLANTARLQVLGKYLQTDSIKAYRDPGAIPGAVKQTPFTDPDKEDKKADKDESTIIMKGF